MALIPKGPGCQFDGDVGGSGGRVGGEVERWRGGGREEKEIGW